MALEAKGVNGQIELLDDRIRIRRGGILGFMNYGFKGVKEIPLSQITAVEFKAAGRMFSGYIQFSYMGGAQSKGGILDAARDENTVMFKQSQQEEFERMRMEIERLRGITKPTATRPASSLDEIERLGELRDKGLITEEEFQAKKRQILGL